MQSINNNVIPGVYNTVAASQATQKLSAAQAGNTGAVGDYLESLIIVAGTTTPGAVTLFDGVTTILSIPAGTATVLPYVSYIPIRAYSKSGSWNITTGASVSVMAIGKFT